jgi:hypothetical protein
MALHSALAEAELHENKGVSTATNNTVATANGSGVTIWEKVGTDHINTSSIFNVNKSYVTLVIPDISTADTVYFYVPFGATLSSVGTVLENAITTADATVTVRNNGGSSAGTITVAYSGSAAGDIDTLTPASNNTFTAGQRLSVETDGLSDTAAKLFVTLVFTITA